MNRNRFVLAVTFMLACLLLCGNFVFAAEVDQTGVVSQVIDGDTFVLESGETIRFADIDTPEINETGYTEAKNYVKGLVEGKTVYLDIDDVSRTDGHDRLVCVVYFDFNTTHVVNLNLALLEGDYASNYDHSNNEFNPRNWNLYEPKNVIPEYPSAIITILVLALVTCVAIRQKHYSNNQKII